MKTILIITSALLTVNSFAQNITLAEWDIRFHQSVESQSQSQLPTQPGHMVADSTADCINNTLLASTDNIWSGQSGDSEDTSATVIPNQSRCFGG